MRHWDRHRPPIRCAKPPYQIFIRATADEVWNAITKPEFTTQYFYRSRVETTGKSGTPIRHQSSDGTCRWGDDLIFESDPPRRLVHTWRALCDPELAAEPPSHASSVGAAIGNHPRKGLVPLLCMQHRVQLDRALDVD